jgi:hypothetical protein
MHPKYPVIFPCIKPTTKRAPKIKHKIDPSDLIEIELPRIDHKRQQMRIKVDDILLVRRQVYQLRQTHNHAVYCD